MTHVSHCVYGRRNRKNKYPSLSTIGQPELEKLLSQVVTKVGKENAGPVLLGIKGAVDNVIKKNKIKA